MIAIVGKGNVAGHLYKALAGKEEVCMVNPHTLEGLPSSSSIILLCVSDNAIEEVALKLPPSDAIIAHTAGSVPIDVLKVANHHRLGVFYPLQTFTKDVNLDYSEIPIFVEGSDKDVVSKLKNLASLISNDIRETDSETRKKLHLASVFACNFTNVMAGIADQLMKDTELDFSVLLPLMKQTVAKLEVMSPRDAQTGPAARADINTIDKHLRMLENQPQLQKIYSIFTDYIMAGKGDSDSLPSYKSTNL